MINANTNAIELTDAELEQVVGGCGGHERRNDCGDGWDNDRDPHRRRRGHQHQQGWSSFDFSEERHVHRSRSYSDDC